MIENQFTPPTAEAYEPAIMVPETLPTAHVEEWILSLKPDTEPNAGLNTEANTESMSLGELIAQIDANLDAQVAPEIAESLRIARSQMLKNIVARFLTNKLSPENIQSWWQTATPEEISQVLATEATQIYNIASEALTGNVKGAVAAYHT